MADLADINDYTVRYGTPDDSAKVTALLGEASSLVRRIARIHISEVEGDVVTLDGDGTRRLFLPEIPVTAVDSVTVDEVEVDTEDIRWWVWGGLDRLGGRCWPCGSQNIVVSYDHGEEVEEWIVGLVCSIVQRALRPPAIEGVTSATTGSQTVAYAVSAAGVSLWVTSGEAERLEGLRGPVLG